MAGITHQWNGTVLTITSDSGTSSADLRGEKGDDGARGPQGSICDTTVIANYVAAKAAPAGYGLGTYAKLLDNTYNLNNALPTGFYRWGASVPVNAPSPIGYAVMLHIARTDGDIIQKVWHLGTHSGVQISAERYLSDNNGEWEWNNPPMELGIEYRTTERWNGSAVYTKLVDCGALPDKSSKAITFADETTAAAFACYGRAINNGELISIPWLPDISVKTQKNKIYITTTDYFGSWYGYVCVKYTK